MNSTNKGGGLLSAVSRRVWILNYSLEESRQRYANRQQLFRQAAACIALALLQLVGVRNA